MNKKRKRKERMKRSRSAKLQKNQTKTKMEKKNSEETFLIRTFLSKAFVLLFSHIFSPIWGNCFWWARRENSWALPKFLSFSFLNQTPTPTIFSLLFSLSFSTPPPSIESHQRVFLLLTWKMVLFILFLSISFNASG